MEAEVVQLGRLPQEEIAPLDLSLLRVRAMAWR